MNKIINHMQLTETLELTKCKNGFWLFDSTRGMNLAMREKTATDALKEALIYYQNRLTKVEKDLNELSKKVAIFVESIADKEQ